MVPESHQRPINIERNLNYNHSPVPQDNIRDTVNLNLANRNLNDDDDAEFFSFAANPWKPVAPGNIYHNREESTSVKVPVSTEIVTAAVAETHHLCPVCNDTFPGSLTVEQFEVHVQSCIQLHEEDRERTLMGDEGVMPPSLAAAGGRNMRTCPMCSELFHDVSQEVYEKHVNEHFGEESLAASGFEVMQ
jgi:hypothetical protein